MASRTDLKEVLVESDFLFGLREGDRHHDSVSRALDMHRQGSLSISVLSSAVVEVRATLYSEGLKTFNVEEVLSLMDATLCDAGVDVYIPLRLSDAVLAERLRSWFPELTFFDSLHAALSKKLNRPLLSSDPVYRKVGVNTVDFKELSAAGK